MNISKPFLFFSSVALAALILSGGCASVAPLQTDGSKEQRSPPSNAFADGPEQFQISAALQKHLDSLPPAERARLMAKIEEQVVKFQAAKKENFCNVMLDVEAATVYDEAGLQKLMTVERTCPTDVPLDTTLEYINKTLWCTFDDPYTEVLAPEEATAMQEEFAGKHQAFKGGGIGAEISMDPSKTLPADASSPPQRPDQEGKPVLDICTGLPLPARAVAAEPEKRPAFTGLLYHVGKNGPAYKAGLRDGDIITKVNLGDVIGLDADHVVNDVIRGPVGSKVKITFLRGNKELTRSMNRAVVLPDNVWSRDLGDGIYAIVIASFERENTAGEIMDALDAIGSKARGYVFDVRNNPGGVMDEAVWAASLFVHDGVIMSQRERVQGDPSQPAYQNITWYREGGRLFVKTVDERTGKQVVEPVTLTFQDTDDKTGKPIGKPREGDIPFIGKGKRFVVVANGASASAAEIFTGAIAENLSQADDTQAQGATFIGTHTFGKFIGQTVIPGPAKTAIKATSFRYFSPKGEWLGDAYKHRTGLTPQIEVKQPDNAVPYTSTDAQLQAAKDFLLQAASPK